MLLALNTLHSKPDRIVQMTIDIVIIVIIICVMIRKIRNWSRRKSDCTGSGLSHCCRDEGYDPITEVSASPVTATTVSIAVDKRGDANPVEDGATQEY